MKVLPCLQTDTFFAYLADNASVGVHRSGYNGVASLIPRHTGNNLFVPAYAGLNCETISLAGLPPYEQEHDSKFEPRREPMHLVTISDDEVMLVLPETSHAHVSARITFRVEEPWYLHQRVELIFHQRFCGAAERNAFSSLFASYLHMPEDIHIYLRPGDPAPSRASGPELLGGWVGVGKTDHGGDLEIRGLPADRELCPAEHLEIMAGAASATGKPGPPPTLTKERCPHPPIVDCVRADLATAVTQGPRGFYYGLCPGELLFLMMFAQPEHVRLAYSPSGAGQALCGVPGGKPGQVPPPTWNPAWDYVLCLEDAELNRPYAWDVCLVVKPFSGRIDVLDEVHRFRSH